MTVYIEYVIIDNMIIDGLLLILTSITLKEQLNKIRIFFSALIGTVFTVFISLISLHPIIAFTVKLLIGLCMVLVAVNKVTINNLLRYYCLFVAYTFLMGGCITGLLYIIEADITSSLTLNYTYGIPIGILVGGIALTVFGGVYIARLLYRKKNTAHLIEADIVITLDNEYHLKGFYDSGNLAKHDNLPILFAVGKGIKTTLIGMYTENILTKTNEYGEFISLQYTTVNGSANSFAIKPLKTIINGKEIQCYLAYGNITDSDYDIILPAEV